MKKVILLFISVASFPAINAQKGSLRLQPGAEVSIPLGDFGKAVKTGFGGTLKGLFGVTPAGSITLTAGGLFHTFKDLEVYHFSIVPILAGYQHILYGFYVEPQVGLGIYGLNATVLGVKVSDSETQFTYGVGLGYLINNIVDLGARFQGSSKDGEARNLVGIHIGYNFTLKEK